MNYASIINEDFNNGEGVGVTLFVQGCHFHCEGCFNSEAWDFNGGKKWTPEIKEEFLDLINKPYITRVSILGGEPLADENVEEVSNLINEIRQRFPEKKIWLYTGYTIEDIELDNSRSTTKNNNKYIYRMSAIAESDVLVDGKYVDKLRDVTLKFRGSSNQRLIDVKQTLEQGEVVCIQ